MSEVLQKASILKKTLQVGSNTLLSRVSGLVRELLLARFLGIVEVAADAFTTAFMIPNSLRKVFAEGALTAAFVPTFVTIFHKEGKEKANELIALGFLFFEGLVLLLCALVMWNPEYTIHLITPGFSPEQVAVTIPCLRILMPFIFFISTSSLLSGALHSVHHFFVPSFSPVLLNAVFIGGILACLAYGWSVEYLCYIILFGGFLQLALHVYKYLQLGFSFRIPRLTTLRAFGHVLIKFIPCFISSSVMEVSLLIDQRFASYLPVGSVTLIKYTSRFMGIPLGVFAVAFSTILLPHFSRVNITDPKRLHFYLLESMKFVFWITIPATLIMGYLAEDIFVTLFVSSSKSFPTALIPEAGNLLLAFLAGLFFFSINKILFNLYYSVHDTLYPTIIAVLATALNYGANCLLVDSFGTVGLAMGTCISGASQTLFSLMFLKYRHGFTLSLAAFFDFVMRYCLQLVVIFVPFYGLYQGAHRLMVQLCGDSWTAFFFLKSFGFWVWVMPFALGLFASLYFTRRLFKIQLYFLD